MLNKAVISAGVKQVYTHRCCFFWVHRFLTSGTEGGEICLAPSFFWQLIPTWLQEIKIPD